MFENIRADLDRLKSPGTSALRTLVAGLLSQGFQAILIFRFFNWCVRKGIPGQPLRFLCERFIEITTGISIPAKCSIGKGLRIHHFGGIIFHPTVKLGENCTLYHDVTIGDAGGSGGAARIGNNVVIGAGAKIIGEITIGDDCIIGANAVVAKDMAGGTIAAGNPSQIHKREGYIPFKSAVSDKAERVPVRIMDLRGTYKGGGGPDKTILLSAAKHDQSRVHVLVTYLRTPNDHEFDISDRAAELGINYIDVPDRNLVDWRCVLELNRILRSERLEIVHAHDDKSSLYAFFLKLMNPGTKIMYTCHSAFAESEGPSIQSHITIKLRKMVRAFLIARSERPILTVSGSVRECVVRMGIPSDEAVTIYNGIDIEHWQRTNGTPVLKQEFNLPEDAILVGTVARIAEVKDLPTLFQVVMRVHDKHPNAYFVIVGDGEGNELEKARNQVRELGLGSHVLFTGHRSDLLNVYASLDVFLMTSVSEGLPNTVLEAMAMEVPVVGTAVGGVPELVVNGETGFLCGVKDVQGLADKVDDVIADRKLRSELAKAGRRRICTLFSFDERVRKMESYYEGF